MKPYLLVISAALVGCVNVRGVVTANDGRTISIEHNSFEEPPNVQAIAAKSCQQAGRSSASLLVTVSKHPNGGPAGIGPRISSFRCE
jgi:hypothetical protein